MTERPGLSIFDNDTTAGPTSAPAPAAGIPDAAAGGAAPAFPVARRGYDTSIVDRKFASLTSERARLAASLESERRRTAELEAQLAAFKERASESDAPTYAG